MKKLVAVLMALMMVLGMASISVAEEPVNLVWYLFTSDTSPKDLDMVAAELNAMSAADIGVTVEFRYLDSTQIDLAMNSGEYFDMAFTCNWFNDYATASNNGLFYDITDTVEEKAPALYEYIPEMLWEATKVSGRNYGVPVMKDYAIEVFWRFDPDAFPGMEIPRTMSFSDAEPYMAAYKEANPNEYPMLLAKGGVTSMENMLDWINRDYRVALEYSDDDDASGYKVVLAHETEELVNDYKLLREWYQAGYINPDAATKETVVGAEYSPVRSGQGWFGAEGVWEGVVQHKQVISRYEGPYLSTASVQGALTAFSAATKYIDECLRFTEYVNTNVPYRTMIRYGIEGYHYNYNDDGTVTVTPEGADGYKPAAYAQGSYAVGPIEGEGNDPDMWEKVFAGYEEAKVSKIIGFNFNNEDVEMECAAVAAIWLNYAPELRTGSTQEEVDDVLAKCTAEMEAAGIRDIIAACQEQLDAWVAENVD